MPRLRYDTFDGIFPALSPRLLPENAAQVAKQCRLRSGRLEPLKGPGAVVASAVNDAATLYRWERGGSSEWLSWAARASVVRAPVHEDAFARIYYTEADGSYKLKAWKSAAAVTRSVGLAAPAAPVVTVSKVLGDDAFKALTNSAAAVSVKVSGLTAFTGAGWSTGETVESFTGLTLTRAESEGDAVRFFFAVPGVEYAPAYATGAVQNVRLRADALPTEIKINNVVLVGTGAAATFSIVDGGDTLATLAYVRWYARNMSVSSREHYMGRNEFGVPQQTVVHARTGQFEIVVETRLVWGSAFDRDRDVYYLQSWVDDLGQESPASPLAGPVHVPSGHKVVIGVVTPTAPVTTRRIYRTATGADAANDNFYFLHEGHAAFTDTVPDAELAEPLPTIEAPPAAMYGLIHAGGGVLAAFKGREVYFSEPWLPFSWPTEYRLTTGADIVALAWSGTEIYVLTEADAEMVTGTEPEHYAQSALRIEQGCASAASVVAYGGAVFYASPDGLVALSGGTGRVASARHLSRVEWQAWSPSSMRLAVQDGAVVGWRDGGDGFVFNLADGLLSALTTHAVSASAAWREHGTDTLWIVQGTEIRAWEGGAALAMTWRGREVVFPRELSWSACRLVASAYPVTLKVYRLGTVVCTLAASGIHGARLPRLDGARVWSIEVSGSATVDMLAVASSMGELR